MAIVDFVYDKDCPNVKVARANLIRAFSRAGMCARWNEHQIGSAEAPPCGPFKALAGVSSRVSH